VRLTPVDVQNKVFHRTFRGYNTAQVDEFLNAVTSELEFFIEEREKMRVDIEILTQKVVHYTQIEATLQNALVLAERTAEERRRSAEKEAELIVQQARQEAKEILDGASAQLRQVQAEIEHLRQQRERFALEFEAILRTHLEMLQDRRRESLPPETPVTT